MSTKYRRYNADERKRGRSFWSCLGNCFGRVRDSKDLSGRDWDIESEKRVAMWIDENRQYYGTYSDLNFQDEVHAQTSEGMCEESESKDRPVSRPPDNGNPRINKQTDLILVQSESGTPNNRKDMERPIHTTSTTPSADTETASRPVHARLLMLKTPFARYTSRFAHRLGLGSPSPPPSVPANAWIVPVTRRRW
jgi:hypothetical protein